MSTLLEQAIADAKAVRATALANAKAALEEAFLPKAEAMLAQKLKEEAGIETEAVFDPIAAGTSTSKTTSAASKYKSAGSIEKNKGLETEKWLEEAPVADAPVAPDAAAEEGEEAISDKELDEILAELSKDLEEEGAAQPVPQDPNATKIVAPEEPVTPATPDAGKPEAPVAVVAPTAPAAPEASVVPAAPAAADATAPEAPTGDSAEDIDLNELLKSLNEASDEEEEEEEETVKEAKEEEEEAVTKEAFEVVIKERNDAVAAVNHYKKQLDEVSLLNAKLLYTNKLFKNYGLTNEQKMKIVETFDLTQTIREVKIAYTSLAESFNFGKSAVKKNTAAQAITEGLASKTVASTKPAPAVIVENTNTQAERFKTLAGIKSVKK